MCDLQSLAKAVDRVLMKLTTNIWTRESVFCFFAFRFCFDFVRHNFCASWIATTPPTEEHKIMQKYIFFYILVQKITTDHKQTLMTSTTSCTGKHCVLTFILSLFIWKPTQTVLQRAKDAVFFKLIFFFDALRCMWKAVRMNGSRQVAFTSKQATSTSPENIPLQQRARCLSVSLPAAVTLQQSVREQRWPHGDDH